MDPTRAGSRRHGWLFAGLFALALALRLVGLESQLPCRPEPDLGLVMQVGLLEQPAEVARTRLPWRIYPHLLPRAASLAERFLPGGEPRDMGADLRRAARRPLVMRALVALLAAFAAPLTWLLARRFLPEGWSVFAGLVVATSLLHLEFSQQARPHAAAASLALLAVLAALRLRERARAADYALAGAAAALAIGALQSGILVLPALALAHALRERHLPARGLWHLALSALPLALSLPLFHPGFVADVLASRDLRLEGESLRLGPHGIHLASFNGRGFPTVFGALASYDPTLLALALLGAGVAGVHLWRRGLPRGARGRELAVVPGHALPYLIVIGLYSQSYERFVLPLLPYAAVLGAFGLRGLARAGGSEADPHPARPPDRRNGLRGYGGFGSGSNRLVLLAGAAALAFPAWVALRRAELRLAPDTVEQAAAWVRGHVEAERERALLLPPLELPLYSSEAALEASREQVDFAHLYFWMGHQLAHAPADPAQPRFDLRPLTWPDPGTQAGDSPLALAAIAGGDFLVCAINLDVSPNPRVESLRNALAARGPPAAVFAACATAEGPRALTYQEVAHAPAGYVRKVLSARAMGPLVEVYDLRR